jgi:excisionase family DNA binding protein
MQDHTLIENKLLTVSEVAAELQVPVSWVYERTRRNGVDRIPHIKLGKYLRFRWSSVLEWLEGMKQN